MVVSNFTVKVGAGLFQGKFTFYFNWLFFQQYLWYPLMVCQYFFEVQLEQWPTKSRLKDIEAKSLFRTKMLLQKIFITKHYYNSNSHLFLKRDLLTWNWVSSLLSPQWAFTVQIRRWRTKEATESKQIYPEREALAQRRRGESWLKTFTQKFVRKYPSEGWYSRHLGTRWNLVPWKTKWFQRCKETGLHLSVQDEIMQGRT